MIGGWWEQQFVILLHSSWLLVLFWLQFRNFVHNFSEVIMLRFYPSGWLAKIPWGNFKRIAEPQVWVQILVQQNITAIQMITSNSFTTSFYISYCLIHKRSYSELLPSDFVTLVGGCHWNLGMCRLYNINFVNFPYPIQNLKKGLFHVSAKVQGQLQTLTKRVKWKSSQQKLTRLKVKLTQCLFCTIEVTSDLIIHKTSWLHCNDNPTSFHLISRPHLPWLGFFDISFFRKPDSL